MTIDELISNLGGQLGLWAGISVLTVAQAIIYCCTTLFCLRRNTPKTSPQELQPDVYALGWRHIERQALGGPNVEGTDGPHTANANTTN